MKTLAIIAEYNPFHLGHKKQYERVLEQFSEPKNPVRILNIMSGNFVQRGEAALLDEKSRAELALSQGASLVLSIPSLFSASGARDFAAAGVKIVSRSGVCLDIACGAENHEDRTFISDMVPLLDQEPDTYREFLAEHLAKGLPYMSARQEALKDYFPDYAAKIDTFIRKPNNILALEYALAIEKENRVRRDLGLKDLKLHLIPRTGEEGAISAGHIRDLLREENDTSRRISALEELVPEETLATLLSSPLVLSEPFSSLLPLFFNLRSDKDAAQYRDMSEDLAGLIRNGLNSSLKSPLTYSSLAKDLASPYFPETRINRTFLAYLWGIRKDEWAKAQAEGPAFTKVLAYDANGRYLLRLMRKLSRLTLINQKQELFKVQKSPYQTLAYQKQVEILSEKYYEKLRHF